MNTTLILLIAIIVLLIISPIVSISKVWVKKGHSHTSDYDSSIDKLIEILPDLPEEIEKLRHYKAKADDYDRLEEAYNRVKKEKKSLSSVKSDLEIKLKDAQQKLQAKDKEVSEKLQKIEDQNQANKELLDKVRKVEHLKDYAGKVFDYLHFFETIVEDANNQCIEFGKRDEETAKIMYALLQQALLKISKMVKWKQICGDIKENSVYILNNDIKNCFQYDNETEQLKAFKIKCISELKIYTNAILILCESYSNLLRFVGNKNVTSAGNEFKNKISEIKSRAKEVGIMEIAEVKIFTNIDNNKDAESASGQISFPYSTVKNLNKDDISEIVEFGMKTDFADMTKTKVLIQ